MALTKQDIKDLCEANDQLQWWAMVLFAEISELVTHYKSTGQDLTRGAIDVIQTKVDEFPRLVVQEAIKQSKEKLGEVEEEEPSTESKGVR